MKYMEYITLIGNTMKVSMLSNEMSFFFVFLVIFCSFSLSLSLSLSLTLSFEAYSNVYYSTLNFRQNNSSHGGMKNK